MPIAGVGKALRGFGKALHKAMGSKGASKAAEVAAVATPIGVVGAAHLKKKLNKKKKADEGLKKLKNIVPHVEYIRSKKKSK